MRGYKEERQWLRGLLDETKASDNHPKIEALWALLALNEADEHLSRVLHDTHPRDHQRDLFMAFSSYVEKLIRARETREPIDEKDEFQDAASAVIDRPPASFGDEVAETRR